MNQIKIGVIGASGNIGRYTHCENIVKYTDGAVLTAVSSSSKASVQKIADHYCVQAMENAEELITSDQVDAVLICSSNETHVPYTIRCLEEGKPVFLEKPMANTLEEAQLLLEAEKKAGEHMVQIGFMRRYDPDYIEMKKVLDSGSLGAPLMVHCISRTRYTNLKNRPDSEHITVIGVHEVDICRWLLEENMKEVMVRFPRSTTVETGDSRDPQFLLMQTENDILIDVEATANSYYGYEILCEVVCEKGTIRLPVTPSVMVRSYLNVGQALPPDWNDRFVVAYRNEVQHWVDYLLGKTDVPGPGTADGYEACRICDAFIRAQKTGCWETV